jgi:hypothetical protein
MLSHVAPEDINNTRYSEQAIQSLERLTSAERLKEVERLLETDKGSSVDAECVRNAANWSSVAKHNKFDQVEFSVEKTGEDIATRSPKLAKILQNIEKLDAEDMAKHGRRFKHFVFSDIRGNQGAKAVAAGLLSRGFQLGYNIRKVGSKKVITVKSPEALKAAGPNNNNFFLLSSVSLYGEPLRVSVKKDVLRTFNLRGDDGNVYGELARIIVMDSGFKEGIDLFDIKYVHIFEPQSTMADQKQVIGRGTRTCGQKGLRFNPKVGWPLYVFKYDLSIDPEYRADFRGSETAFAYYLLSKNVDIRLLRLASNLERVAIKGSVDYELNRNIHEFSTEDDNALSRGGKASSDKGGADSDSEDELCDLPKAEHRLLKKMEARKRPGSVHNAFKKYVRRYFSDNEWEPVKMENLCGYDGPTSRGGAGASQQIALQSGGQVQVPALVQGGQVPSAASLKGGQVPSAALTLGGQTPVPTLTLGGKPNLIKLSPTQEFISTFFTYENPLKGMVLWQSVGTGKTCTAIATATRQFEPLGYTILWVTRTTLKNDIWKNMFEMVCHEGIRDQVAAGIKIPESMPERMRLLSKSWAVRPISYKQFSNLVSKNNQYYDALVKRNGEADPLRKTLIIIDEAHKLYGGGDLSSIERPDMPAFHKALMNSYAVSGKDSARVLFMTATPITDNPLELVKLVNLCRTADQQIPDEFDAFSDKYLDDTGDFTPIGSKIFLDDIAGHISYLNREGDVRQFSKPILREVAVPLVDAATAKDIRDFDVVGLSAMDKSAADLKLASEEAIKRYDENMGKYTKGNAKKIARVCDEYPDDQQDECRKLAKKHANNFLKTAKRRATEWKARITATTKDLKAVKGEKMAKLRTARTARKDHPNEYEEYQKSAYYKMRGCEKPWKAAPHFDEFLDKQPGFYGARDLADTIKEEVVSVENRLKADVATQNARIRSYSNLLKTDLTPLESQVVRSTIQRAKTNLAKTKKRNVKWSKRLSQRAKTAIERLEKHKKAAKTMIQKSVKEYIRNEKRTNKQEQKLKKLEEDADESLPAEFLDAIHEAKISVKVDLSKKQGKRMETEAKRQLRMQKAQATQAKAQAAAEKREQNAQIKQARAQATQARAQAAAEKKQQKAANATRKAEEKAAKAAAKNKTAKKRSTK